MWKGHVIGYIIGYQRVFIAVEFGEAKIDQIHILEHIEKCEYEN